MPEYTANLKMLFSDGWIMSSGLVWGIDLPSKLSRFQSNWASVGFAGQTTLIQGSAGNNLMIDTIAHR